MNSLITHALDAYRVSRSSIWWRRSLLLTNLTPPVFIWLTGGTQLWAWLYAIVVHHILLVGLFFPRSNWLGSILNQLPTEEKIVWLTIDDGPSEDTVTLAKMLGGKGISATFFLQGNKLVGHAEVLATLKRHGHTVANHTQNHDLAWFWLYPPWKVASEIDDFQTIARDMQLPCIPAFRCPAGLKNPFLYSALRSRQLTLIGWTIRAYDGIRCDREKSLPRILSQLTPGAIILVHEGKKDAFGKPASIELIGELVTAIQEAGYRFA